jgi:hypothetical protein
MLLSHTKKAAGVFMPRPQFVSAAPAAKGRRLSLVGYSGKVRSFHLEESLRSRWRKRVGRHGGVRHPRPQYVRGLLQPAIRPRSARITPSAKGAKDGQRNMPKFKLPLRKSARAIVSQWKAGEIEFYTQRHK